MEELFAKIYEFFGILELYSSDLGEHLRGYNKDCTGYDGTKLYLIIGISMIGIAAIAMVVYYYLINHPRFNQWYHWLTVLLANSFIQLLIAFILPYNNLKDEVYCKELTFSITDCFGIGMSNFIWSAIVFTFLSYAFRWGSRNAKYSPF